MATSHNNKAGKQPSQRPEGHRKKIIIVFDSFNFAFLMQMVLLLLDIPV